MLGGLEFGEEQCRLLDVAIDGDFNEDIAKVGAGQAEGHTELIVVMPAIQNEEGGHCRTDDGTNDEAMQPSRPDEDAVEPDDEVPDE